jgi:RecA-family ATPase
MRPVDVAQAKIDRAMGEFSRKTVVNFPGSQPIQYQDIDDRFLQLPDNFQATEWLIKGVIPEGVGVISGTGGVGKTTSLVPLALVAAGFQSPSCDLEPEIRRRVFYVTEDPRQVMTILNGMRRFLKWDDGKWSTLKDQFRVIDSRRMTPLEVSNFLEQTMPFGTEDPIFMLPLVVFDTASSNFEITDESNNSEVSAFMALIKEFAFKYKCSIWIISHLAKTAKSLAIDEIQNLGSRGASAWEDNAQWTALLGSAEQENKGPRVLTMQKKRDVLEFNEIIFEGAVQHHTAINRLGAEVNIDFRYTVPRRSSKDMRISDTMQKKESEKWDRMVKAIKSKPYPSRKDVAEVYGGKEKTAYDLIKEMLLNREVVELDLPENLVNRYQKTYLAIPDDGGAF